MTRRGWLGWVGCLGLIVMLTGTFLPWLRSGTARRNSYAASGLLRRLLDVPGWRSVLLHAWPFLALICAAVLALTVGSAATAT